MKSGIAVMVLVSLAVLCGCASVNLSGSGTVGDTSLGANVNPLDQTMNVNAGTTKTLKMGGAETTINTSTDGSGVNVDADVQQDPEGEE